MKPSVIRLLSLVALVVPIGMTALAAPATECTKIGICYCVNDDHKQAVMRNVERLRAIVVEQRKAGKSVGYLSVPLTSAGGGNFDLNK